MSKTELIFLFSLFIIAGLTVFDLFLNSGHPATMDGLIHITSIAQFGDVLRQGEFPVIWLNNFATYGLPVGVFSHQLPLYVGALIDLLLQDPVLSYKITLSIGVIGSSLLLYSFLRLYAGRLPSLVGAVLFSLTPYKVLNIYIRGALPEVFAGIFLPIILLSLYFFLVRKKNIFFFVIALSTAGLALTHPMMLFLYSFIFIPYLFLLLWEEGYFSFKSPFISKKTVYGLGAALLSMLIGIGIASYYLIPLFLEKKYFYFGQQKNFLSEQFLTVTNFIDPSWHYFFANDIYTRGHIIKPGILEIIIILVGIVFLVSHKHIFKRSQAVFLWILICVALFLLFMTLSVSKPIYDAIPQFGLIQFPWRMLSGFIFIPPIVCAFLLERYKNPYIALGLLLIIIVGMAPQLYGKNFVNYPTAYYHATRENLHSVNMNTVWTGKTEDYPVRTTQSETIEGKGKITDQQVRNSSRTYTVNAQTSLRMVDYTFYFPGWSVYVDGVKVPIEFQNPDFRGVITYQIPPGEHNVRVVFQNTATRFFAQIISLLAIIFLIILFFFRKRSYSIIKKYV